MHQIFLYFLINSRSAGQTGANKSQMRRQKSQQAHHCGAGPRPPSGLGEKNSKLVRDVSLVSCIVSAGRRGAGRPAGPGGAAAVTAERAAAEWRVRTVWTGCGLKKTKTSTSLRGMPSPA